jgi:hypothetical protein
MCVCVYIYIYENFKTSFYISLYTMYIAHGPGLYKIQDSLNSHLDIPYFYKP